MIIDGKQIADDFKKELYQKLQAVSRNLNLHVILIGDDPASVKFVERKKKFGEEIGVEVIVHDLIKEISQQELEEEIEKLANDKSVNGIIVQLPVSPQVDADKILSLIPPEKDVDALGENPIVLSPVVLAVQEVLKRGSVVIFGEKAAVIGQGKLVGRPVAIWLAQEGADVSIIEVDTLNPEEILRKADIIVSGVGKPGLIALDAIKPGVVLIDAGASLFNGKLVGDADPACAEKCSIFTPVPGGVGPITVAMLFKNLLELSLKI